MKKLLAIMVLGLLWSSSAFAKIGYFECKSKDGRQVNFEINLNNRTVNIFQFDYSITAGTDRKIHASREGLPGDKNLRTVSFDRYTGELIFVAHMAKIYVESFRCAKISDKKIF